MVKMMFKETREKYVLTEKDELVLTFKNGELLLLINNETKILPQSLSLSTEGYEYGFVNKVGLKQFITRLNIECGVSS